MTDETPLSLDGALGMLIVKPEDTNTPPPAADTNSAPPAKEDAPAQDAPPAADAANTDAPADQGNTTPENVEPDALPNLDPPKSWTTEEKAEWNSLNRKAQEAILRRDRADTQALRTAQDSTAESNKKVEAEVTRLKGLADQVDSVLNEKLNELAAEFSDVKSEADFVRLAQTDPARAQVFQAKLQALAAAKNAQVNAQAELQRKSQEAQQTNLAQAKDKLLEAFPAWKDPEVARREVTELQDYVVKEYGVSEATARATLDPTVYKLAQKAMLYDKAQAKAAAQLTRTPPKTITPGNANVNQRQAAADETRRSQLARLDKSGDLEDAIGLLRA